MRVRVLRPSRAEAIAALASAALFAFSFPPFDLVVPVFLCLVPVTVAVARLVDEGGTPSGAARLGFWFGLLGYGANLYWIAVALSLFTRLAIAGYVASLLWLSPFVGAAFAALFAARRATRLPMAVLLPVVWVALELALNYLLDLSFPWLPLGLAVAPHPLLAQIADLSGVRGLSFWVALTNGLAADAWLTRHSVRAVAMRALAAGALVVCVAGYGAWRLRTTPTRPVAVVAVVQPNVPEDEKLNSPDKTRFMTNLASLTRSALRDADPALVVWPETALPGYLGDHPAWLDSLRALAAVERTPILFGVLDVRWKSRQRYDYFNSAMLTDSLGLLGAAEPYHKGYLVPIVERVPFVNPEWFAGIEYFGGFGRGAPPEPFELPFGRVGVLICYESIFPQLARRYRNHGADLLVNITNDAWFGRSSAPHQHFAHLALRAIETRTGIVRSANTGISAYVDPLGRVHGATALFVPAARSFLASTSDVRTLYVRVGDWLGVLCLLATVALVMADKTRRPATRPISAEPIALGE